MLTEPIAESQGTVLYDSESGYRYRYFRRRSRDKLHPVCVIGFANPHIFDDGFTLDGGSAIRGGCARPTCGE